MNLSSFTDVSANDEQVTDIDSGSETSRRRKNQNTFSWSSMSSSYSQLTQNTSHAEEEDDEEQPIELFSVVIFNGDSDAKNDSDRICQMLSRAASHGDVHTVRNILYDERLRPLVNIDSSDDDCGSTPLIYAACFGNANVVRALLEAGATVDKQDKLGWTALMWATTNGHGDVVQALLEYSACKETKSNNGRTMFDLVDTDDEEMVSILSITSSEMLLQRLTHHGRNSIIDDHNNDSNNNNNSNMVESKNKAQEELTDCEASFRSVNKFIWDQCLPDQMFVFAEEEIEHILNVSITDLKLPMKSRSEIYVPANIIFLSARFAHYFTSREILHSLLNSSIQRIGRVVKTNMHDIHTMSFWIANLSQLLYYLKKDTGLVVATAEHQLEISELISETYSFLVSDSEKRLDRILESAMIEYEQLGGLEPVHFVDEWQRFFRRGRTSTSRRSMMLEKEPPLSPRALAPQSVASLLTSTLYVLQSYEVHPVIVIQAIAQLFHYISCEIFNRILVNKKYLCRSKALQIRMNLTVLEEWVREHQLPSTLSAYFDPVIQLVQLLQCVSQLSDLMDFINTTKAFDLLNPMQVRRLILNYRYEVNEPKLPEEIEKYTMQIAEDTLKSIQKIPRQSTDSLTIRTSVSRPNSMSSLGSLLYNINGNKKQQQRLSFQSTVSSIESTAEDELEEERELLVEKRDSKYMLPFSLPTTTNMLQKGWSRNTAPRNKEGMSLSDQIYFELKQKLSYERERDARERSVIPNIPETWLERLDHHAGLY